MSAMDPMVDVLLNIVKAACSPLFSDLLKRKSHKCGDFLGHIAFYKL